jgi:hypothetical protein
MKWFVPSWCGDYRLVSEGDEKCALVVVKPTEHEKTILLAFLKKARSKKWTGAESKKWTGAEKIPGDKVKLVLEAPVAKVAPVLVKLARPAASTVTAVKFEGGELNVVEGTDEKKLEEAAASKKDKKAKAAVSVKRPTMSCPQCVPGSIGPATEVLLEFLTPEQHKSWARRRAIEVTGHMSGHRYVLAHRHSRLAQKIGRICYDLDDRGVVHFHDLSVPPEEEVLAAKLFLEHREPWVRNEASCLEGTLWGNSHRGFTDVFKNPFGDLMDGVLDATIMRAVGNVMLAFDPPKN